MPDDSQRMDDDFDHQLSVAAEDAERREIAKVGTNRSRNSSLSLTQRRQASKRKTDVPAGYSLDEKRRKENEFTSALRLQIKDIDPDDELTIHHYLTEVRTDPVIKEYTDILIQLKFLPSSPSTEDISTLEARIPKHTLSNETKVKALHLLITYFQCRYFNNNITNATAERKSVLSVNAKMSIPNFKDMPATILKRFTESKKSLAIHLQSHASDGTDFTCELLKLRTGNLILEELKDKLKDNPMELNSEIQHHFSLIFLKAKMEFVKQYPMKKINWTEYEDKTKHVQPSWRTADKPIPETRSFYATEITARVTSMKESFTPADVKTEYIQFLGNCNDLVMKAKNKSHHRQPPPPPAQVQNPPQSLYYSDQYRNNKKKYNGSAAARAPPPLPHHHYSSNYHPHGNGFGIQPHHPHHSRGYMGHADYYQWTPPPPPHFSQNGNRNRQKLNHTRKGGPSSSSTFKAPRHQKTNPPRQGTPKTSSSSTPVLPSSLNKTTRNSVDFTTDVQQLD